MPVRVAINGFGRIGRLILRSLAEHKRKDVQVVAINDLGAPADSAHLFRHDSVHGNFPGTVTLKGDILDVGMGSIKVTAERDPTKLPWKAQGIDLVMECTGIFTKREKAAVHLDAGAKRVLISAPGEGADATIVYGINHKTLKKQHRIISNGSCTTNCLAPVADVLNKLVGIKHGFMTTVHAYTGDQNTIDTLHKDPRRARAAALSMIPSTTGAAKAIGLVLPELKGKLDGVAVRVPTPNVSMIDLTFVANRPTTAEEINKAMTKAAKGHLKGVLGVTAEPLVSIDFNHNDHSSTFDLTQTQVIDGTFVRVLAWYDNEWGFSTRMADTAACVGKLG
ncbi:MAG: type I glyceraldehyde-3-phosphate dehydrogenase [Rhodospirillales bacterium]|nr:type I glyceraldehyde-3-phosphate dehydrogenase [Rhodospirillales bacterium]